MATTAGPVPANLQAHVPTWFLDRRPTVSIERTDKLIDDVMKKLAPGEERIFWRKTNTPASTKDVHVDVPAEEETVDNKTEEQAEQDLYGDMSKEEIEQDKTDREQLLASGRKGRVRATVLGSITEVPAEIAKVIQASAWPLRKAWRYGRHQRLLEVLEQANKKIDGVTYLEEQNVSPEVEKKYMKEKKSIFRIPVDELFSMVELLYDQTADWVLSYHTDPKKRAESCRRVAFSTFAAREHLDRIGLTWKTVVDPEVSYLLGQVLDEGLPLVDKDSVECGQILREYLERDQVHPLPYQLVLGKAASEPMLTFFKSLEGGDVEKAREALEKITKINDEIQKSNEEAKLNSGDHILPIDGMSGLMQQALSLSGESMKGLIAKEKNGVAAAMFHTGYVSVAKSLCGGQYNIKEIDPEWKKKIEAAKQSYKNPVQESANQQLNQELDETENLAKDVDMSEPNGLFVPAPSSRSEQTATSEHASSSGQASTGGTSTSGPQLRKFVLRGPVTVQGPRINDDGRTLLGKVTAVMRVGGETRAGYRSIVNVGTEKFPVHRCISGSKFGRGMGEELFEKFAKPKTFDVTQRKASHLEEITMYVEVESTLRNRKRDNITYFGVKWAKDNPNRDAPFEEVLTRSQLLTVCDEEFVEETRAILREVWLEDLQTLQELKESSLHPDTQMPLTDSDRTLTPWLFPRIKSQASTRKNNVDEEGSDSTNHIRIRSRQIPKPTKNPQEKDAPKKKEAPKGKEAPKKAPPGPFVDSEEEEL